MTRGTPAILLRFIAMGLAGNLTFAVVLLLLARATDSALTPNLAATVVSTVLVNELHRRVPFRTTRPGSLALGQGTGGVMAAIGLCASSLALTGWAWLVPDAGHLSSLLVVYGVDALVGLANFVTLHRVFSRTTR